ncbi:hypothetical protein FRB94_002316 [Tulasnella sp. JGI-2019a]|nr:hypothetical protein FRB94_002316 [Tulasnella sp. JGI-2019a]KAG9012783.1 hypothetical protein FRB93_001337 [Tulasnella sp. JGI-2019a]
MNTDTCNVGSAAAVWSNATIEAAYCASNDFPSCLGLCPNTDLAGIGVRLAFYLQAAMNALLMVMSPEDAAGGAWAATVLTAALIIPAIIQKTQQNITLHHSVLVLNFATLSCVASLASAPLVPIWRGVRRPGESSEEFAKEQLERTQGRKVLSFAILAQIILQWVWSVLLFVNPYYAQTPCSGSTVIVFFFGSYTADEINEKHFVLWAIWLLMCVSMSFVWGAALVLSCRSPVHDERPDLRNLKIIEGVKRFWKHVVLRIPDPNPKYDRHYWTRWGIRISTLTASLVVLMYIIMSEMQIKRNVVLSGENQFWTFSQSAAVLLALTPLWPIAIAFSKPHPGLPRHGTDAPGTPRPKVTQVSSFLSFSPSMTSPLSKVKSFRPRTGSSSKSKMSTFTMKFGGGGSNEPTPTREVPSLDYSPTTLTAPVVTPLRIYDHNRIPSLGDPWPLPSPSAAGASPTSPLHEIDERDAIMPMIESNAYPLQRLASTSASGSTLRPRSGSKATSSSSPS